MAVQELSILGDWTHSGTQAAGTLFTPSAHQGGAELDTGEVAEVLYAEVFPPVTSAGAIEDLRYINFTLDRKDTRNLVTLSGRKDSLMTPPRTKILSTGWDRGKPGRINNRIYNSIVIPFGKGIEDAINDPIPALTATTMKYKDEITIITQAGSTDVTADYRIRLWGYKYQQDVIPRLPSSLSKAINFFDRYSGMQVTIPGNAVTINHDNWTSLPGGPDQDFPFINPFWRFAQNANATTANTPYQFRFDNGNVADQREDMQFAFDSQQKMLLINGLGVRTAANSKYTWLDITGDPIHQNHPKGKVTTLYGNNPMIFGSGYPELPADLPLFYTIPQFIDNQLVIYQQRAFVDHQDNGTSIPANSVTVALNGVLVERQL